MALDGGTAELFKFPTGAPFVGAAAVPEPRAAAAAAAALAYCQLAFRGRSNRP